MTGVDLVWLSQSRPAPSWVLGRVHVQPATPKGASVGMERALSSEAVAAVVVADGFGQPPSDLVRSFLSAPADVWHSGLALGLSGLPKMLDHVHPIWMLKADAPPSIESTSWRLALHCCMVRLEAVRALGGPDPSFSTLAAAGLEWGLRLVKGGAVPRHVPQMAPEKPVAIAPPTAEDEARIIRAVWGRSWVVWAILRLIRHGRIRAATAAVRQLRAPFHPTPTRPAFMPSRAHVSVDPGTWDRKVSVLVPTLDRYEYLSTLLRQLVHQTVEPLEVVVVDQTPDPLRRTIQLPPGAGYSLRVLQLDVVGQCTARNAGLEVAAGDLVLLLDDDDEVPPDLLERHLDVMVGYAADASCGAIDEVGVESDERVPDAPRVSDVFPTGNTLIRMEALEQSGLFDLNFDGGSNEDHDLGTRLHLSGALIINHPRPRVLHHRAPRGGLRAHGQRTVTRAMSRQSGTHRRLPSVTELYLAQRYFSREQVQESAALYAAATLRRRGSAPLQLLRVLSGLVMLPDTYARLRRARREAAALVAAGPRIPKLASKQPGP